MMGKAKELQSKMGELQEEMKAIEATGQSGGGAVTARVNGGMALVALTIDPAFLKPEEAGVVEDLVIAAYNDAREKVEVQVREKTEGMMGGLGLPPGLAGMKFPFGG